MTREITNCRSCKSTKLESVLSLGELDVINMGDKILWKAPLELIFCKDCTLVQLRHTVDPEYLFRSYYYKSGVNQSMKDSLLDIVKNVEKRIDLEEGDRVVDIGANDGTLLAAYTISGLERVAFEPATGFQEELRQKATHVIADFFNAEKLMGLKARVITSVSMFYDLEDPNAFLEDVKEVLAEDGLFVIQQNYLPKMLELNAFDNIVHEHLEYYSMTSLKALLIRHRLWPFDVEFNDVNGGSFRVYITHLPKGFDDIPAPTGAATSPHIYDTINREKNELHLDDVQTYKEFARKINIIKKKIHDYVASLGRNVYIAGASTRGNTLVQVCELQDLIEYAVERNPAKFGKTYCGKIQIISEKTAEELPPDYYLVLPWHFLGEFVVREQKFLRNGGKLLIPLPKPAVLEMKAL